MRLVTDRVQKVRCPDGRLLVSKAEPDATGQVTEIEVPDFDTFWLRRLRDGDVKKAAPVRRTTPRKQAKAED